MDQEDINGQDHQLYWRHLHRLSRRRARLTFSPPPPFFDLRRGSKTRARASRLLNFILIDMIIAEELVILNGRTLGDLTGNFTCLKYNGNSVIDYAATSIQLHDSVKSFKVLPFTPYSDHKPIEVCLAISNDIGKLEPACLNPDLLDDQPIGYKWVDIQTPGLKSFAGLILSLCWDVLSPSNCICAT